jgi:sugar lactone lactonase YvrE
MCTAAPPTTSPAVGPEDLSATLAEERGMFGCGPCEGASPEGLLDSRRGHGVEVDIRVFGVTGAAALNGGEVFATCDAGTFDGIRLDASGRIWAAAADGLHCFDPDGTLIGKLHVPEVVANFTFGGAKRNHLFICASSSLYSILVNFNGARYPR